MSAGIAGPDENAARPRITGYCRAALANALNGLTGAGFEVFPLDQADTGKPESPMVWKQPFSVADGAVLWLIAGKDLWEAAGEMILGGAGVEAVTEDDCRSTWSEIAGQTMGGIAQAMTAELGRDIQAQSGAGDPVGPGEQLDGATLEIRGDQKKWRVRVAWTAELAQACSVRTAATVPVASAAPVHETVTSKTLDLLLDVALPVSVSFGRTSLQIREVLKLNTGSVIELDRLVSEPVEVIVNNCVIARGEVVVVDGNYGVRVIHLASREDRLRSGMSEASSHLGMAAK
jgi:flagellar motor switch protein FliN/FliY